MQNSYKTLAIIAIVVSLTAVVLGLAFKNISQNQNVSQNQFGSTYSGGVTNSSTTLQSGAAATTSNINAKRQYMSICNDNRLASSSAVTAYLNFVATDTALSASQGIPLEEGECYEINQNNLYTGEVWVIATDTVYLTVTEK